MKVLSTLVTIALATIVLGCVAKPPPGPGRDRVVLCHKGKTIDVAAPAVDAHLRHGDTRGRCR